MTKKQLFDDWTDYYESWFKTPIGKIVRQAEARLVDELLDARANERILDVGCGTGIFTYDILLKEASVVGLDISQQMLVYADKRARNYPFYSVRGDMLCLPFPDNYFDKVVSVTAIEFIEDAKRSIDEMIRVTRPGGYIIVATLNSLSPWAARRKAKTLDEKDNLLENAFFRSPADLLACSELSGTAKTVIHFQKDDDPREALKIEQRAEAQKLDTGAFVTAKWQKPA